MPSLGFSDTYAESLARAAAVRAKIKRLGIRPGTRKYDQLFYRWIRR